VSSRDDEEEFEDLGMISDLSPRKTQTTQSKLEKLMSKAGEVARRDRVSGGKRVSSQNKSKSMSNPCSGPLVDAEDFNTVTETVATSKRVVIAQASSSSASDLSITSLPHILASTSTCSQVLDLSYDMAPRVTTSGEFILHATYIFTSPTKSSQLPFQIQASNYHFCPHISTFSKTRCDKPPRPLISEIGTTVYEDRCEFCWTEFEVEVRYAVVGIQKATKVIFRFWHSLRDGEADDIWKAAQGNGGDRRADFEVKGTRQRWETAA
jgi:hypothetical protein